MATDLFFLESDRHRVGLLAKLLVRLGIDAVLGNEATAPRSETILVVCTAAASGERWLLDLLERHPGVIALMLDSVALPRSCMRAVDLTNWPARSADTEVAALVRWLKNPTANPDFGAAAARRFKYGRAAKAGADRDGPNPWLAASLLVGLVAGFGLLLWSTGPAGQDDARSDLEAAELLGAAAMPGRPPAGVPSPAASPAVSGPVVKPALAASRDSEEGAALAPPDAPDAAGVGSPGSNDALSRLCRAPDPTSANAWLGALNWKQRQHLPDAVCVRQLATRPGFETFAVKLASPPG